MPLLVRACLISFPCLLDEYASVLDLPIHLNRSEAIVLQTMGGVFQLAEDDRVFDMYNFDCRCRRSLLRLPIGLNCGCCPNHLSPQRY